PVNVQELSEHGPGLSTEPVPPSSPHRFHQPSVLEHLSHEGVGIAKLVLSFQYRVEVPHVEASVAALILTQDPRNDPSGHFSRGWAEALIHQALHPPRLQAASPAAHASYVHSHQIRGLKPTKLPGQSPHHHVPHLHRPLLRGRSQGHPRASFQARQGPRSNPN